ncbi:MAG: hypothetical protein ABID45_02560 [Patescibacteria group bacterium]
MTFYKNILGSAYQMTKKHKFLWLFGFFVVLLGENGGEYEFYIRHTQKLFQEDNIFNPYFWLTSRWEVLYNQITSFVAATGVLGYFLLFILALALLLVIYFVMVSQASIVKTTDLAANNKKVSLFASISLVRKKVFSILGLNIILKGIIYTVFLLIGLPLLSLIASSGNQDYFTLYLILGFVILFPIIIVSSFLTKYAINFIVLKEEKFLSSIVKAWKLFIKNWLITLEMALVIFVLNIAISLLIIVLLFVVLSPFLYFSILNSNTLVSSAPLAAFLYIVPIIVIALIALVGSMFSAFQWSAWTILFDSLVREPKQARILGWIKRKK